ncbi:MAG: hypothetical protein Q7S43_05165 [bacterium]|nr:hypothetical protein [bacterium]
MDGNKILEVIAIYRKHLTEDHGVPKIDYPHDKPVFYKHKILSHCHGMLDQMEEFVRQGRIDKAFRWLGFVQGCLWSERCYTLDELKNHNRPNDSEGKE